MISRLLASVMTLAVLAVVAVPAGAVDLVPHRALYRMTLLSAGSGSGVVAATGAMDYRFARDCDGWTVENRTLLKLIYGGGEETRTAWTFVSWESVDGLGYRFGTRYEQDGATVEKLSGTATLEAPGGTGAARFASPEDQEMRLPAGTQFSTSHMRSVLDAAAGGGSTMNRVVFDGATLDNPYKVSAVFGQLKDEAERELAETTKLPTVPGWWLRMAFFALCQ